MWLGERLDVCAYVTDLKPMWRVCATLDLALTMYLYSGLSAGKKQLICSLIHIYQELI